MSDVKSNQGSRTGWIAFSGVVHGLALAVVISGFHNQLLSSDSNGLPEESVVVDIDVPLPEVTVDVESENSAQMQPLPSRFLESQKKKAEAQMVANSRFLLISQN